MATYEYLLTLSLSVMGTQDFFNVYLSVMSICNNLLTISLSI